MNDTSNYDSNDEGEMSIDRGTGEKCHLEQKCAGDPEKIRERDGEKWNSAGEDK
jgi:hypothetical protein